MNQESAKTISYIIGGSVIISFFIFGLFYYAAQSAGADTLSVTGSAKTQITSDQAKLTIAVSRTVDQAFLASGYASVARDVTLSKDLLKREGVDEKDITEGTISTNQVYDYDRSGGSAPTRYEIRQTVTVQSTDVVKLTAISKKVPSLASQGAFATIQSLEYYYSKLPELRVSLLAEAVKDAKARAETIASGSGRKVGGIKSASSGVVQLLPLNSVDVSDYGTYDTSSIEKDVMVTVKASFSLK
jgi:hypothetical protein